MADEVVQIAPKKNRGGAWITFGLEAYRVPPLSFLKIQELQERIKGMADMSGGQPTQDQMATVIDVVFAAIVRNYPELTREEVADMVDLGNYQEVLGAVLSIAGFKAQEQPSGEAQASIGTGSTSP